MNGKLLPYIFAILLTLIYTSSATAESIEKADSKDIEMLLDAASGMNSAYWASYIGETRGRIYIEYETAIHASSFLTKEMKRVVYWLPVEELETDVKDKFIAFKVKHEARRK